MFLRLDDQTDLDIIPNMRNIVHNPHDNFFRSTFGELEIARDFLENYLPLAVRQELDLSTLTPDKETFVDPELQPHHSDMLYHVQRLDGADAYVYLLFEHKSWVDKEIGFQLLEYMVQIWKWLQQ